MNQTYASKIDTWLLLVLLAAALLCVLVLAFALRNGATSDIVGAVLAIVIGVGLPLWVFAGTCYRFTDDQLHVKSGPFKWEVPLAEITAVTPTRNPMSSPALSLDRLRIDYGRGKSVMISPRERQQFLQDLEQRRSILGQSPL